jgi:hypothetical protein
MREWPSCITSCWVGECMVLDGERLLFRSREFQNRHIFISYLYV